MRSKLKIFNVVMTVFLGLIICAFGISNESLFAQTLKVGQVFRLDGVDLAGNKFVEIWEISGKAQLHTQSHETYLVTEVSGDLDHGIFLGRWSKEGDLFFYSGFGNESLVFANGEVGTYWEYDEDGSRISAEIIATGLTVEVPAGIYYDCILIEKHSINGPIPSLPWYEWVKPGLFIVQWLDFYVDENAPVWWQLTSIEKVKQ